jgi:hypothetical protein
LASAKLLLGGKVETETKGEDLVLRLAERKRDRIDTIVVMEVVKK